MASVANAARALNGGLNASAAAVKANTTALGANTAALDRMAAAMVHTHAQTKQTSASMGNLRGILGGLTFGAAIAGAIALTDAYALMNAKLGIAVDGLGDGGRALEDVSRIANQTRSGLTEIASLYSKVSFASKDLGKSQADVSRTTETVAKALKVSGATAQEATSTILQLGQALASGRLQGDEFRAMSENAPRLMRLLADSTQLPVGALKQLGSEGKITSDIIIKAFTDKRLTGALDSEFAKVPLTFADNMTLAKNAMTEYLGENATAVAGTKALGDTVGALARNLDVVVPSVLALSTAIGVGMVTNMLAARVAAGGLGGALLGAFGGPIGLAITGVTLGLASYAIEANKVDATVAAVNATHERLRAELDGTATAAKAAAGETKGVGTDSLAAIPHVDSFAGATGRAAQALYEQAHAAREARKEILKKQLAESQGQERSLAAVLPGGRKAANDNAWSALTQGDFATAFDPTSTMAGLKNWWSGGREDRENSAAYSRAAQNSMTLQSQLRAAETDPLGRGDLPRPAVAMPGKPAKTKKGKTDAQRSAEAVRDYWVQLEKARDISDELPIPAAQLTKEYELQKAYAIATGGVIKALGEDDKNRLATLLQQTRAGELLRDLTVAAQEGRAKGAGAQSDFEWAKKTLGLSQEALNVAQATREWTERAGREGVSFADAKYQLQLKTLEATAQETFERERQTKLLKDAPGTIARYDPRTQQANDLRTLGNEGASISAAIAALEAIGPALTADQQKLLDGARRARDANVEATQVVADRFRMEFAGRITTLGDQFGAAVSKIGTLLEGITAARSGNFLGLGPVGGLLNLVGRGSDGSLNKIGKSARSVFAGDKETGRKDYVTALTDGLKNPLKSIGDGFGDLGKDFGDIFKKGGDFQKGVGSILGKVGAGAETGAMVAGLGNALGIKMSGTGAQLGGALGGLAGPIGSIVGSLIGGIGGNLLKKAKYATTTVGRDANGDLGAGKTSGNSDKREKVTIGVASSIGTGLEAIAAQVGGMITGTPNVSIGTYKDKWRVSDAGRTGKLKGNYSDVTDFGKDGQADAIEYAIRTSLEQGVLTGVSTFTSNLLKSTVDLDKAVNISTQWEAVLKANRAFDNPIAGMIESVVKPIETLRAQMVQYGATASDLAEIDKYRTNELDKLRKAEMASIQDVKDMLLSAGSGRTALTRLNADLTKLSVMEADIASGKTVDQDAFQSVIQSAMSLNSEVYGTATSQSQANLSRFMTATNSLEANITKAFEAGVVDPVVAVTNQTNAALAVGNDLAMQQVMLLQRLVALNGGSSPTPTGAVNGLLTYI